jgi:hypothetical protein
MSYSTVSELQAKVKHYSVTVHKEKKSLNDVTPLLKYKYPNDDAWDASARLTLTPWIESAYIRELCCQEQHMISLYPRGECKDPDQGVRSLHASIMRKMGKHRKNCVHRLKVAMNCPKQESKALPEEQDPELPRRTKPTP